MNFDFHTNRLFKQKSLSLMSLVTWLSKPYKNDVARCVMVGKVLPRIGLDQKTKPGNVL